jgi:hypothetical protein
MRVVPADAPAQATPQEVDLSLLRGENAALKAQSEAMASQLAEMQKTLAELTAKKGR